MLENTMLDEEQPEGAECALCKEELDLNFVRVEKNGKSVWIHGRHPRPGKEVENVPS